MNYQFGIGLIRDAPFYENETVPIIGSAPYYALEQGEYL
jgi:hypothetical protein